jgi:integrase
MPKLTKRFIDSVEPEDKEQVFWDDDIRGFGLRVKPSGVKSYIAQYRNAGGKSQRKTLGRHGEITADQARKLASEIRHAVASGDDPVAAKAAWKAAPTVNDLMDEYLSAHVASHNKPTTQAEVKRLIERHIRPALGKMKVQEITRQDVSKLHRAMKETPRQANFVLSIISKAFNLAETWGYRSEHSNPVRLLVKYKENARDRVFSADELAALGATFRKAVLENMVSPRLISVFTMLAFTGCRLSEILTLTWKMVDFENGLLNFPDAKAGARSHVLSSQALDLLANTDRVDGIDFVFPNATNQNHFDKSNVERVWRKLVKAAGLKDLRIHDLRHTVGTAAGSTGANAFQIQHVLGHKTLAMTGRYVARDDDPVRGIQNRVSAQIEAGLIGKPSAEIIPLRKA